MHAIHFTCMSRLRRPEDQARRQNPSESNIGFAPQILSCQDGGAGIQSVPAGVGGPGPSLISPPLHLQHPASFSQQALTAVRS